MYFDNFPFEIKEEILKNVIEDIKPYKNYESFQILENCSLLSNDFKNITVDLINKRKLYLSCCNNCRRRQARVFPIDENNYGECRFCWDYR